MQQTCVIHPDKLSLAACSICEKPFCGDCLTQDKAAPTCTTCAQQTIDTPSSASPAPQSMPAPPPIPAPQPPAFGVPSGYTPPPPAQPPLFGAPPSPPTQNQPASTWYAANQPAKAAYNPPKAQALGGMAAGIGITVGLIVLLGVVMGFASAASNPAFGFLSIIDGYLFGFVIKKFMGRGQTQATIAATGAFLACALTWAIVFLHASKAGNSPHQQDMAFVIITLIFAPRRAYYTVLRR